MTAGARAAHRGHCPLRGAAPDVRYNFPVSALNPAPNLIESINVFTPNNLDDVINIRATSAGSVYYIETSLFAASDDTVNISSDAPANTGDLNSIDGQEWPVVERPQRETISIFFADE